MSKEKFVFQTSHIQNLWHPYFSEGRKMGKKLSWEMFYLLKWFLLLPRFIQIHRHPHLPTKFVLNKKWWQFTNEATICPKKPKPRLAMEGASLTGRKRRWAISQPLASFFFSPCNSSRIFQSPRYIFLLSVWQAVGQYVPNEVFCNKWEINLMISMIQCEPKVKSSTPLASRGISGRAEKRLLMN